MTHFGNIPEQEDASVKLCTCTGIHNKMYTIFTLLLSYFHEFHSFVT